MAGQQANFLLTFRADFGPANSAANQFAQNMKRTAKDVANIPPPSIPNLTLPNNPRQAGAIAGVQEAVLARQLAQRQGTRAGGQFNVPPTVREGISASVAPYTSGLTDDEHKAFASARRVAYRRATEQIKAQEVVAANEGRLARISTEQVPLYQRILRETQQTATLGTQRNALEQRMVASQALIAGALERSKASSLLYREELRPDSQLGAERQTNQFLAGRQGYYDSRERRAGREAEMAANGEETPTQKRERQAAERYAAAKEREAKRTETAEARRQQQITAADLRFQKIREAQANKAEAEKPENKAAGQLADADRRRAIASQRLALQTEGEIAAQARTNAAERINNERLRAAELQELRLSKEGTQAKARRVVAEKLYNDELRKAIQAEARAQGVGGQGFLARAFSRGGGGFGGGGGGGVGTGAIPQGAGGLLAQRAMTSLSYTLPSLALFAGGRFLFDTIKEAEELDRVFTSIESQFESTFGEGSDAQFKAFKGNILEIARDTGIAGEELANIAFQLQGAFGTGVTLDIGTQRTGVSGTDLVQEQTRAAAEISRVTGLSAKEINDSLTAASLEFETSFRDIGDITIKLQDFTGVLAKETIPFLGDIAPVAKEAGFSLEEFAAVAGVAQQRSGRGGAALAEAFGRVIPAIEQNRVKLLEFAAANDALSTPEILNTIATGNIRDVFFALGESFESMDKSAQKTLISLLGGRREAQSIQAVFSNFGDVTQLSADLESGSEGALAARFEKLEKTLSETLARLSEKIRQVGVQLFEGGLGDALVGLADAFIVLADILGTAGRAFGAFNDTLGGIPAKLLAIALAIKTLQALGVGKLGSSLSNGFAGLAGRATGPINYTNFGGGPVYSQPPRGYGQPPIYTPSGAASGVGRVANAVPSAIGVAAAVTSVLGLVEAIGSTRGNIEQAAADTQKRLVEKTEEELRAIVEETNDGLNSFYNGALQVFTGKDTNEEIKDAKEGALAQKIAIRVKPLIDSLVASDAALNELGSNFSVGNLIVEQINANPDYFNESVLKELIKARAKSSGKSEADALMDILNEEDQILQILASAEGGNRFDAEVADIIAGKNGGYANNEAVIKAFAEANSRSDSQAAMNEAQAGLVAQAQELSALQSEYEAGGIPVTEFLAALQANVAKFQGVVDSATATGGIIPPEIVEALNGFKKQIADVYFDAISANDSIIDTVIATRGDEAATIQTQLARQTARLTDPQLNNEQQTDAAIQVLELRRAMFDLQVSNADSAEEALAILNAGYEIPEEAREQIIIAQLNGQNIAWQNFLTAYKLAFTGSTDAMVQALVVSVLLGKTTVDAQKAHLQAQIASLTAYVNQMGEAAYLATGEVQQIADLQGALDALNAINTIAVAPGTTGQATGAEKKAAAEKAKSEREKAAKDRADAAKELAEAEADLAKAMVEGDPVRVALLAQQEADRQYAEAENQADRIRAQAERIRANRQLEAALFDITQARRDLVQAQLEAAGDTVGAAQASVQAAREDLARLEALAAYGGAGEAQVTQARAALVRAETQLRDEQFQKQLDDYEFLYDTGQITRQQFIQYLRGLQAALDPASKQFRDLERQIRGLEKDMGQDLQFNLPSNFTLPTLYESRRINQGGGSGGINDNRQINVVMYVTNGMTEQQAADFMASAVGGSNRFGITTRRY